MEVEKIETVRGIKEVFGNREGADGVERVKNKNAVALGSKGLGRPKTLSDAERKRRADNIRRVTAERVAKRQEAKARQVPPTAPGPVTPADPAPSLPDKRFVSAGKVRSLAPSSRAYPARKAR